MIKVTYRNSHWEIPGRITIKELIKNLGLDIQAVLALRDGKLVHNDTRLGDEGEVQLISVISGG